jgi:hypothetical protein
LWLGAWLFKPQLALPVIVLVAVRHSRIIFGVAISSTVLYLIGTAVAGPAWPAWWWREGVVPFAIVDLAADRGNGVSFREVTSELGVRWLGWCLAGVAGMFALFHALRSREHHLALVGLGAATAALVAPHALYYDAAVGLMGLLGALQVFGRTLVPVFVVAWLLALTQPLRMYVPLPPLTLVLIVAVWFGARALASERTEPLPKPGRIWGRKTGC